MQALGNALTILGIAVTLVAYFGQHSGVSLADLEPGLVARWRAGRAWVRRKLRRPREGMVVRGKAALALATGGSVVVWSWKSIQPEDDLTVRVDKLAQNLDQLRKNLTELRELDTKHFRKVTEGLSARQTDLRRLVNERHQQSQRQATAAMRWEVRGLLITLVGAGLSVLG